ncbi:Polysaccharide biosynthesis protein [uncultured archaeon]|nr:Polysaccharide biosynthesis protein [uncultured archaeon]
MIEKIKSTVKSELFIGSLILMILINIGNVINYIFHFSMARMLGPASYGIFAVLANLIYIFSVPTLSIQTLVSKHTTKYKVKKEYGRIKGVFNYLIKETLVISLVIYVIFLIASIYLSKSLNISFYLLALTGVFLFIAFISPIPIGILQGMKKFNTWGWNYVISCLSKLLIAIILVLIGFRVYGAILGFIIGTVISFFLVFPFIKEILYSKEIKEKVHIFSRDNLPTVLAILMIVLMYSVDVIFVKIFFDPETAGKYAIVSLLGKIILFGTSAVGNAMFPISSEKYESGGKSRGVIKKTYLAVGFMCICALLIFGFFPELIIKILFGARYLGAANILIYVATAFSVLSLLNIFILYKISINKFRLVHSIILALLFILELLVMFYTNSSLELFSISFMISTIIIFIASVILIRK